MLGREREWLVAHDDAAVSPKESRAFATLCERRAAGVPVAYLLDEAHFYGCALSIDESVLVPRPETEHLVDEALEFIGKRTLRVLDVGTGSGAIACAIAANSSALIDATDISAGAIRLASENARRLKLASRCRFHQGDLIEPVRNHRFDVIVANLPYVPTNDLPKRPDPASFEPREALDGGPDGLALYKRLLPQLPPLINEGALVLLEAAPPTTKKLANMLRSTLPNFTISVGNDYSGLARYVKALDPRAGGWGLRTGWTVGSEGMTFRCGGV